MLDRSSGLDSLLARLNAHTDPAADAPAGRTTPPTPDEAMAMYHLTARLVELQLELAEQGTGDEHELQVAREVLVGTRQVLLAALRGADDADVATVPSAVAVVSPDDSAAPVERAEAGGRDAAPLRRGFRRLHR